MQGMQWLSGRVEELNYSVNLKAQPQKDRICHKHILFLAHLSQRLKVSYFDLPSSVCRP